MPNSREALAEYAHDAWSGWITYMFSKCKDNYDETGTVTIPQWAVERWSKQAATKYADLSEEEKDSDRDEADKMLTIMEATQSQHVSEKLNQREETK